MNIDNSTDFGTVKIVMLKGEKGDQGESGDAGDYSGLSNKPSINNVTLVGNKTPSDFGLATETAVQTAVQDASDALSAVQDVEDVIGTGSLDTTAQTIIPAINELFHYTEEDISSHFNINGAWTPLYKKAYRIGNMVHFYIEVATSTYIANYEYTVATIDSGYRPQQTRVGTGHTTDSSYAPKAVVSCIANSNGAVTVLASNNTGNYFFISGSYEIA